MAALFASNKSGDQPLVDAEFGDITVRYNARARSVRLRMLPDGSLVVTLPRFASMDHARQLVESSRSDVRLWRKNHAENHKIYQHGDRVGRSHSVVFMNGSRLVAREVRHELKIVVSLPPDMSETDAEVQKILRPQVARVLQKEARAYLPRRLDYLAKQYGFSYQRVRYGTQKGRWGSCSTSGTISLNVGLMNLDFELIDYVLIHELCHTKQMNHSPKFWQLVETCLPGYKNLRKTLKAVQPVL